MHILKLTSTKLINFSHAIDIGRLPVLMSMINNYAQFQFFSFSCIIRDACNMQINIDIITIKFIFHDLNLIGFDNNVVNF